VVAAIFGEQPFGQFVAGTHPKTFAQLTASGGLNIWVFLHLARSAQVAALCIHCLNSDYGQTGWQWVTWHGQGKAALVLVLLGISGAPRDRAHATKPKKY